MAWQRLSGAHALALNTETPTTPAHYVVLIVMEASDAVSHQRLHELAGSSLPRLARFRSRLFAKPLGLGQPVWAEVADFDPSRQLHKLAVPPPGGTGEFADIVAKLTTRPMVRHKPLWQAWSIEGLAGGRWALALKVSRAIVGGVDGLAAILTRLVTATADDDPASCLPPEPGLGKSPSLADLVADTAAELTGNQLAGARLAGQGLPTLVRSVADRLRGGNGDAPVPRTAFNDPLSPQREVAFSELRRADIDAIADALDVSSDDVFLAACTLSLRTWLQRHAEVPEHPLAMQFLASPTPVRVRLPVQHADPAQVLRECHAGRRRETHSAIGGVAQLVPPNLLHTGMQVYTRLQLSRRLRPVAHGVAATIQGPRLPVYCAGAPVAAIHAVPPLTEGAGLSISQVLHDQAACVTVCACPDRVTGIEEIADGIVYGVTQLRAKRKKRSRRRP
ncbi:MAG: DUF1298 domain-containing protein [Mycobacteriaceae bacterium]|nr:DUF1298 domain-containing protein [Mycobacteriaceae bacterium]